jgi:diguanylate cyclase (GGDEF)-like protein
VGESAGSAGRHLVTGNTYRILGYSPEQWAARRHWADHIHIGDRERVLKELARGELAGTTFELEYRMIGAMGKIVHITEHVRCERDAWGNVSRLRGVMLDVTKQLETEDKNRRYGTIVEHLPIGIIVLRATGGAVPEAVEETELVVVDANTNALTLLRQDRADVVDQSAAKLFGDGSEIEASFRQVLQTGEPLRVDRTALAQRPRISCSRCRRSAGFGCRRHHHRRRDRSGGRRGRADVIKRFTTRSPGLPNRTMLTDRMRHALADARRSQTQCALLVMDLDQFKEINDTLATTMATGLLSALADRFRLSLRECDTIARLGATSSRSCSTTRPSAGALKRGGKVLACASSPFDFEGLSLKIGASVGVALFPDHATDSEMMLKRADIAMYTAKRAGGGVTVYEAEHDRSSLHRLTLVGDLRHAIEQDELRVVYQPIADLHTGAVDQLEALTRWAHPRHGVVLPTEFIHSPRCRARSSR